MASALMEVDDSPILSEDPRISDLESQILNSQESMVRLSRELDNALLRIMTLETICSENQIDLHEKRSRIKELINEIDEREEINERLTQELVEKNQYQLLFEDFGDMSINDLRSQIQFDRQLRQLILDQQDYSVEDSPQAIIDQFHQNQRSKFHDLLQESLTTEDISHLIDSDDILFELLTHLNSLSRLKETLSRDSKQLQHIRSVLHLPMENFDGLIDDLITKRECIEYMRSKIEPNNPDWTDLGLTKHVLHDYFNFQQQQMEIKEYLGLNEENEEERNYSRLLIERCNQLQHVRTSETSLVVDEKTEVNQRLNRLKEITNSDDEEEQFNLIRSSIQFQHDIRNQFPTLDNDQSILQQIEDYQSIINALHPPANHWTDKTDDAEGRFRDNRSVFQSIESDGIQEKRDVEVQTNDSDEFHRQIKELIGMEDDHPEAIIDRIQELSQISQTKIDENEKLLVSTRQLNENYHRLEEEHDQLVQKEHILDQSIQRLMNKLGLSSDSSSRTQIDEICNIFDTFSLEYSQSASTNIIETFRQIQAENTRIKTLIDQLDFNESTENCDSITKFQMYISKVDTLCQLIAHENVNIDQALINYRTKLEEDDHAFEKVAAFKQQLLARLAIENEEEIFRRLDEITAISNDATFGITSLNTKVSEQQEKIIEYEDTVEKLRSQRERMLTKMKEIKINNESLTSELQTANRSIDEFHRKEIDYKHQIEAIEQLLRSANTQVQVTLDDCQTQEDLQETMKLEIDSLKNEIKTQKKLYENRCRQIMNEKKQLEKASNQSLEDKQLVEEENKRLQIILHNIKDSLENVEDIHSIVDGVTKLQHDFLNLYQQNERIQNENNRLLSNILQQESTIKENLQTKTELDKRLIDTDKQLFNLKNQFNEHLEQYQQLQTEFQSYKDDHPITPNQQAAMIHIEQSPPPLQPHLLAVQQAAQSNNWMTIDMKDEEIPPTTYKHTAIALLNLLGELKSKLGITLTHRPRSSSVFFLYLCAVHLLTFYFLFFSHC